MANLQSIKSKKSPAFQCYPADFLNDDAVEDMSFTEIGVYFVMLCKDWLGSGLPNDFAKIAKRISSGSHTISEARLAKLWAGPLSRCFEAKGERLFNPRLEVERKKQRAYSRDQSGRGKLGGRPPQKPPLSEPESTGFVDEKPRAGAPRDETNRDETKRDGVSEKERREPLLMDVCARELLALAPDEAQCAPLLVEPQLHAALQSIASEHALSKREAWAWLKSRLESHKRSHQWRTGMVKRLDRWLAEGLYRALPREESPARTNKINEWRPRAQR